MNDRLADPQWRSVFEGAPPDWHESAPTEVVAPSSDANAEAGGQGLVARDIGVRVGRRWLLQGVSLALQAGEVGVVLGPNGAGKSTLLSVLAGLTVPDVGNVRIDGRTLVQRDAAAWAARRAVLPQDTTVAFDFSVLDIVALGRYPHRLSPSLREDAIVAEALAATDVSHLAGRGMAHLSGGERLRVQLARVLAQIWEPPPDGASRWLLLDEPTAALDLRHQHEVLGLVRSRAREQSMGVLLVLHDLNLALRYADRVWVIAEGQAVAGGAPSQVLTPRLLADVWRVGAAAVRGSDGTPQLLTGCAGHCAQRTP